MTSPPPLPITLFVDAFFSSPFDFRCWVALREKGLDFTVSRVMMAEGQSLPAAYREQSITARVPGLAHGDFWLAESIAIIEYLEETFPPPHWPRLWPVDPRARARARQVVSFLGSDLMALIAERRSWTIVYPSQPQPLSAEARLAADELTQIATHVVRQGIMEPWSIAAADLTFWLLRLVRGGETLSPELQAFVQANSARPSVDSFLRHDRPPQPPTTGRRAAT